jgi:hypothetical protein
VTDEAPEVVEQWLARAKPTYPIAIAGGAFERQISVPHFPYSAVVGPDGNLVYAGDSGGGEGALDTALGKSKKQGLWPKTLGKVTKLMTGDPVKAYAELKKLLDGGKVTEPEKPYVDGFVAYLEGRAQTALADAKSFRDKGHVFKAARAIEAFSAAPVAFPSTADSQAFLKELQALPEFKKEFAGGEAYAAAERLEKDSEFEDAFEAYKSVSKKFAGTKIGDNARAQAERLRSEGMPGFESACESCMRAKKACDKHKKDVKL